MCAKFHQDRLNTFRDIEDRNLKIQKNGKKWRPYWIFPKSEIFSLKVLMRAIYMVGNLLRVG